MTWYKSSSAKGHIENFIVTGAAYIAQCQLPLKAAYITQ